MTKQVHKIQRDETIKETGIQLRTDEPFSPQNGQVWFNSSVSKLKAVIGSTIKEFAFVGETAGQTLYSTTVSNVTELKDAVNAGVAKTIYLRIGTYDLKSISSPGLNIEKSLVLIGEKPTGGDTESVRIITDSTRLINVSPSSNTITNTGTVQVTNNSNTVTLVGGFTWTTNLIGQYFVINGVPYKIASNPTTTSITLERKYNGPTNSSATYYIANKIDGFHMHNISVIASDTTHDSVKIRNVRDVSIVNCNFHTNNNDTIYGSVNLQYVINSKVHSNKFENFRALFLNNNYDSFIVNNNFISTIVMGTVPSLSITTNAGTSSLSTRFLITSNEFYGPAPSLDINDSSDNVINSNIIANAFYNSINLNGNSNQNTVTSNRMSGITGSSTLIEVNGDRNVINSNILFKASSIALNFTATASNNTCVGNIITGGGTIADVVLSNQNRIEDDLTRLGQNPSGFTKDFIDKFNEITKTLQNSPSGLVQQNSSINSGVLNESLVSWDTVTNEYKTSNINTVSGYKPVGVVKLTGSSIGDVYTKGLVKLTNTSNYLNIALFNSSYINEDFYLGVSGQLLPESKLETSGVPGLNVKVGKLLDVVGVGESNFYIDIQDSNKYGSFVNDFTIGKDSVSDKEISIFNGSFNKNHKITFSQNEEKWYYKNYNVSGEITQPFNRKGSQNSIYDSSSSQIVTTYSSGLIVNNFDSYTKGIKKSNKSNATVLPNSSFSGVVHVFYDGSGVVTTTSYKPDSVLLKSIYNSGNTLLQSISSDVRLNNSYGIQNSGIITPDTNSYVELARTYFPSTSGLIDTRVSFNVQAKTDLQELNPYQVASVKLQANGSDVEGSEIKQSLYYVSGETSYANLSQTMSVRLFSTSGTIHELKLLGKYEKGGSTDKVDFYNINFNTTI